MQGCRVFIQNNLKLFTTILSLRTVDINLKYLFVKGLNFVLVFQLFKDVKSTKYFFFSKELLKNNFLFGNNLKY